MELRIRRQQLLSVIVISISLLFRLQLHQALVLAAEDQNYYHVGMAMHDMTGPAAEMILMGYAPVGPTTRGIHQRLFARAFIIGQAPEPPDVQSTFQSNDDSSNENARDPTVLDSSSSSSTGTGTGVATKRLLRHHNRPNERDDHDSNYSHAAQQFETNRSNLIELNPNTTICFVSVDIGMGSDILNIRVLRRLDDLIQQWNNNNNVTNNNNNYRTASQRQTPCNLENLSISGTHTHSAPGGYLQYALYQIPTLGYTDEVLHAYAEGIAQAIFAAYQKVTPSTIRSAQSWLVGANRNRSPTSYLLNAQSELDEYKEEGDTDKTMTQLTFHSTDDATTNGILNWFAVHGTSMNSSNHLISGDNKGYASYLMERYWNGNGTLPGSGNFVAAFASTNLGDVSPNTAGPHCIDTGEPCDNGRNSSCDGNCDLCRATGPGKNMLESTAIIGNLQYEHSRNLAMSVADQQRLYGEVAYRHSFIDMSNVTVVLPNNTMVKTCPAALGYSFAAGTTDGPGQYPFEQGTNTSSHFFNVMGGFLSVPSQEQIQCQAPKPILLNVGKTTFPYQWMPSIVPISVFRVGQLFILNVPAEFTTMAGRRLRNAVNRSLWEIGFDNNPPPVIVIAGLSNSYSSYVTTREEYFGQRYEAASTLYGPNTLAAYIQEFQRLVRDLMSGSNSTTLDGPRDRSQHLVSVGTYPSLLSIDTIGVGRRFGSIVTDAREVYTVGETAYATFRSANPRNNLRTGGTFLTVDLLNETDGTWRTQFVDDDWCTQYHWRGGWSSERFYWGNSFANITWTIPNDTPTGMYRICHFGTRQTIFGTLGSSLSHGPAGWLTATLLGFQPIALPIHMLNTAYHFSDKVRQMVQQLKIEPQKDFHGCSRTFLVRG